MPRSRKAVPLRVFVFFSGDASSSGKRCAARNSTTLSCAPESSNQLVPVSDGLAVWLEISRVYRSSQL